MPSSGGPLRVLVVEDDQLVRTFLRFALERDGMRVDEVENGADALARVAVEQYDAVLADGLLPDMHGVVLADRILDDPRLARLPLCFLSGAVQGRVPPSAGLGCLSKPVRPAQLTEQIRALVAWREQGGSTPDERRAALRRLEGGFLVGP
ncbi:MAG TPA: response regulator [Candidatus Angelobacter sp.]|jgi:CheY-like chemotaxis protein|nr:response regulator [Candidatus Angelobacter sp.]